MKKPSPKTNQAPKLDVSPEDDKRYNKLVALCRAETLTPEEHVELILLSDQREQANVRRITKIIEMANEQNITLDELMDNLGIRPKPYL